MGCSVIFVFSFSLVFSTGPVTAMGVFWTLADPIWPWGMRPPVKKEASSEFFYYFSITNIIETGISIEEEEECLA
jgi:hypothetical protein